MKKIAFVVCIFWFSLGYTQSKEIRLIVQGDDMGFSHSGNLALIQSYKNGVEKSIEILAPSPWFPEAVKLLAANPGLDVGVHLTLTSEWDNIKFRPLTSGASLRNTDGYFYPFVFPNKNYPGQSVKEHGWNLVEIEAEFRAQIELVKKYVPRVSHVTGHMGCVVLDSSIQAMTDRITKEYGIDIKPSEYGVKRAALEGPHTTSKEKITSFVNMINKLEPGNTYHFIEHPGIDNSELQAISHMGYENVAIDRQGVTDMYTSALVKTALAKKGVNVISWTDLIGDTKDLFNGKDHTGWHIDVPAMDKDPKMATPFIIRNGNMVSLAHTGGHIITNDSYSDYRLDVDYRFSAEPGNCGILVHSSVPRRLYSMFPQSIEVQLMHKDAGDFWCIGENIEVPDMESRRGPKENWGVDGNKQRRIINLTDGSEKPVGQWNHARVECLGDEVKVWINGILVNHGYHSTATKGQIALQAEGSEVEFREVRLTKITSLSKD